MRCPKCQYIGFDSGERCRNCGYEFALAVEDDRSFDVTIRRDEPGPGRMHDLALTAFNSRLTPAEPLNALAEPEEGAAPAGLAHSGSRADLPLFTNHVADDQAPLVTPPAVPRPPLAVRRAGPSRYRARVPATEPSRAPAASHAEHDASTADEIGDSLAGMSAGVVRRAAAGLIDLSVLGTIIIAVIYLTLRVAGLPVADWRMLPGAPLAAFLLLLCGGYFTLFTAAGGQTIGKMIVRIRVVDASADPQTLRPVSFGTAFLRALICFCSVVALGAGFLPVLFRADRRAFHDQIAETRVVSA